MEGRWGVGVREAGQHKKRDKTSHFSCRGVQVEGRQLGGASEHPKCDVCVAFRVLGGRGAVEHLKHAHVGAFWVFDMEGEPSNRKNTPHMGVFFCST